MVAAWTALATSSVAEDACGATGSWTNESRQNLLDLEANHFLLADRGQPPVPLPSIHDPADVSADDVLESRLDSRAFRTMLHTFDEPPLHVELPPEDFSELDEGRPKFAAAGLDADSFRSVVGGRVQWTSAEEGAVSTTADTHLLWLYEYLQSVGAGSSGFFIPGDRGIFAVQGLNYGSNWAILGGGLNWKLAENISAFAGYDAQVNSQQLFHIGSGGLRYAW